MTSHTTHDLIRKGDGMKLKRGTRFALLSVGLAGVLTAVTVAPGWATPPSGLTNVPLARGTNQSDGTIPLTAGTDAGQAFIERPVELDDVLNAGTVPYVLYVTFPSVPQGVSPRTDEPDPGTCPGL